MAKSEEENINELLNSTEKATMATCFRSTPKIKKLFVKKAKARNLPLTKYVIELMLLDNRSPLIE